MAFTNNVFRGPGNPGSGGVQLPMRKILIWAAVIFIAIFVLSVAGCGIKVVDTGQQTCQPEGRPKRQPGSAERAGELEVCRPIELVGQDQQS